ncbi:hypothetical protein PBY51_012617 [Eleginops maclovinus]|uniref:Uncharacterized protein n=1 Tax=Eleginops maclovinus TaxID=56733 RepID=A0AAN7XXE8_ELEMC|nr:hypothetical protein PBY51_012617 [Eleginops maclovinus]
MFGAETNQSHISKERLSMPPRAEGCPEGTLRVCVGAGGAQRKTSTVLFVPTSPPANFFQLETKVKACGLIPLLFPRSKGEPPVSRQAWLPFCV